MTPVKVQRGSGPIVLGQPHGGTFVPDDIFGRMNETGRRLSDTDWHINRLYQGLIAGMTVVEATFHRYVIDANRDPAGVSLYPGQNTTTLCPLTDFDGNSIWQNGQEPSDNEVQDRRTRFHAPYHTALTSEIDRITQLHGFAILLDCHSIRSNIPFLFEGTLPVFSIGTNSGTSCAPEIERATWEICDKQPGFDAVLNGRFKGGWTTRHYGNPDRNVHAIQMELAQRAYMTERAPWEYQPELADRLRPVLSDILHQYQIIADSGVLNP